MEALPAIIKILLFLAAAAAYALILRTLQRREQKSGKTPQFESELARIAFELGVSEYDLFQRAAGAWRVSGSRVEADFNAYLSDQILPHYVRDFVRKHPRSPAEQSSPRPEKGFRPPPVP